MADVDNYTGDEEEAGSLVPQEQGDEFSEQIKDLALEDAAQEQYSSSEDNTPRDDAEAAEYNELSPVPGESGTSDEPDPEDIATDPEDIATETAVTDTLIEDLPTEEQVEISPTEEQPPESIFAEEKAGATLIEEPAETTPSEELVDETTPDEEQQVDETTPIKEREVIFTKEIPTSKKVSKKTTAEVYTNKENRKQSTEATRSASISKVGVAKTQTPPTKPSKGSPDTGLRRKGSGKSFQPTVPKPFNFSLNHRLEERDKYDKRMKAMREDMEERERQEKIQKEKEEEVYLKEKRKSLVRKAKPIQYYNPITIVPSKKPLTVPEAPNLILTSRNRTIGDKRDSESSLPQKQVS